MKNKIYIIDGYNFIYRLFYAVPPFSLKDGTPVNTVFGLAKIFFGLIRDDKPDYVIFVLDYKGKNFREEIYSEYKATRDKMPSDLKTQESLIFELLEAFEIPQISIAGYEADDIIGTLATKLGKNSENEVFILSGDKDLYQFISPNVSIYDTMKKKIFHKSEAIEKFGVEPNHIVDYLSICGDSSDNIPGIPGFGPKKAQELINRFGTLENIYENIEEITGKTKDTLIEKKEIAFLSKKLATIPTDLDFEFDLENHLFKGKNLYTEKSINLLKRLEFKSLLPSEHVEIMKNFDSLKLKIKEINTYPLLDELKAKILKEKKVSISTYSEAKFTLDRIVFYFGGDEIIEIITQNIDIRDFLKEILESEITLIGYNIKEDYKRIMGYIDSIGATKNSDSNQMGLF